MKKPDRKLKHSKNKARSILRLNKESKNMASEERSWKNDIRLVLHALELFQDGVRYKDIYVSKISSYTKKSTNPWWPIFGRK